MLKNEEFETLLTAKQIASGFGVCCETIRRWTKKGLLKAIRLNSRTVRYFPSDVARLVKDASA
jgi:predicted site-specific integrase-resolvase